MLVFFVVFFNAFQGVREVDQNLVANMRVLGASPLQVARHVTIPSAMTWIIASLHTAFGFAIIGALVAEVLGAQHGIGLIISQAQGQFDPDTVFAGMVIIAVVTLVAEYLITLLEKRVLAWRPPSRSEAAGHLTPGPTSPPEPHGHQPAAPTKGIIPCSRRTISLAAVGALRPRHGGLQQQEQQPPPVATPRGSLPTVKMMVGGIDKQIYLPYQLAQNLGFYKKYGVNVELSTEPNGGVGAEDAMASGQVDMAGAWYIHTIDFQSKGKNVIDLVQLSGAPGEREMCGTNSGVTPAADFKGKTLGVTDLGSGTDELTQFIAAKAASPTPSTTPSPSEPARPRSRPSSAVRPSA